MFQEKINYLIIIILILTGFVFIILALWLPNHIEQMREHGEGGVSAEFTPGFVSLAEAIASLITAFSILSAIAIALFVLPSSETKSTISILLSVITLIIFLAGIVWTLYISLIRPLAGTAPSPHNVYWSLRLLLMGLSFTMFTLASRVHQPV